MLQAFGQKNLRKWGDARVAAGGGYSDESLEKGEYVWKIFRRHEENCGLRQDEFADLRDEVLEELQLRRHRDPSGPGGQLW